MNNARRYSGILIAAAVLTTVQPSCHAKCEERVLEESRRTTAKQEGEDRSRWTLRDREQAISKALQVFGIRAAEARGAEAQVVTLGEDNTPFLNGQITKRPIWRIRITNYRIKLPSVLPGDADQFERTFDILLDPRNGRLLKIASRWSGTVPESATEPRAIFAEQCFRDSGREKYHSFLATPPMISFLEVLDTIYKKGVGNPLVAKQIVAHCVMRSSLGREPQRVWALTLRGIPPLEAHGPGVPVSARDHLRFIVNADTGEWLFMTTCPQPESRDETSAGDNIVNSQPVDKRGPDLP